MASEKTTELQLNIWKPTDNVSMSEFNENFQKIDSGIVATEQKIDNEIQQVTQQLAQNITDSVKKVASGDLTSTGRKKRAIVSFVSDDGAIQDYTVLKPIFESEGVPCTSAIITSRVGTANNLSKAQILELQSIGWEIASHTVSHIPLANEQEHKIDSELFNSKRILEDMGCKVNNFIYPFGSVNNTVKRVARKYYRSAGGFGYGAVNVPPHDSFNYYRPALGAYFDNFAPGYGSIKNTFNDYYKPLIDEALAKDAWLVFTLHPASSEFDAVQQDYLRQTIQYVKSLSLPIMTVNGALDRLGNVLDVSGYSKDDATERYFRLGGDGSFDSSEIKVTAVVGKDNEFLATNNPADFKNKVVTSNMITSAGDKTGLPEAVSGLLTTDKTSGFEDWVYQTFRTPTNAIYTRKSKVGGWNSWIKQEPSLVSVTDVNAFLGSSLPSEFPISKISQTLIGSSADKTGLPVSDAGLLITDLTSGYADQAFQTYKVKARGGEIYTRVAITNSTWNVWKKNTSDKNAKTWWKPTSSPVTIPANGYVDLIVESFTVINTDVVIATPYKALPTGLSYYVYISESIGDNVTLRVTNHTASSISMNTQWQIRPI